MAANTTQTSQALVVDKRTRLTLREIARPVPKSNQVLVKISHVAQNPTDVKSFDSNAFGEGAVYGCDFAGEVVEVGDSVSRVNKGDVIAGLIWGGEIRGLGAYSEYTLADEKICFKIPQGISPDAASTLPLASATAWLALFSKDCLDIARGRPQSVLVWGGSSSVGQYTIQLAKLEGLTVITTCSPKNSDLARTLGADHVFDYRSSDVVDQIKSVAPDLRYVFDTIGSKDSSEISSQAITGNGVLCTVRPGKANTEKVASNVKITDVLVWKSFLKEHRYGKFHWPANESAHKLSSEFFDRIPGWLESGKLKPNPVLLLQGLESVSKGFELHRQGKISAQKIVYKL